MDRCGVSIPLRKFRKPMDGGAEADIPFVSIPLRKFRKPPPRRIPAPPRKVSIPLRKFRKERGKSRLED